MLASLASVQRQSRSLFPLLLNQVLAIANDSRRLEPPRFMKSINNTREVALTIRCLIGHRRGYGNVFGDTGVLTAQWHRLQGHGAAPDSRFTGSRPIAGVHVTLEGKHVSLVGHCNYLESH
jgi:hypothetical protein